MTLVSWLLAPLHCPSDLDDGGGSSCSNGQGIVFSLFSVSLSLSHEVVLQNFRSASSSASPSSSYHLLFHSFPLFCTLEVAVVLVWWSITAAVAIQLHFYYYWAITIIIGGCCCCCCRFCHYRNDFSNFSFFFLLCHCYLSLFYNCDAIIGGGFSQLSALFSSDWRHTDSLLAVFLSLVTLVGGGSRLTGCHSARFGSIAIAVQWCAFNFCCCFIAAAKSLSPYSFSSSSSFSSSFFNFSGLWWSLTSSSSALTLTYWLTLTLSLSRFALHWFSIKIRAFGWWWWWWSLDTHWRHSLPLFLSTEL